MTVSDISEKFTYNGNAHEPNITVTAGKKTLERGTDYDVSYYNNVFATDKAIAKITMKGDYTGEATKTFTISRLVIEKPINPTDVLIYNGDVQKYPLPESEYYVISKNLASEAGTYVATVSLKDASNTVWADGTQKPLNISYTIAPLTLTDVTVSAGEIIFGASTTVKVHSDRFSFTEDVDYTVDRGTYNAATGKATATVTFKGNFSGAFAADYNVISAAPKIESFLDFNNSITDKTGKHVTEMFGSDPVENYVQSNGSAALHTVAGRKTGVKINNVSFGTGDFSFFVSVLLDSADITNGTNQGNAIIESGAHSQYNCDGNNKNNCPVCNGAALTADKFDCISVAVVKNEVNGEFPYRIRVQIGKENLAYKLSEAQALKITSGENYLNFAITVDRQYAVSGTVDTTRVTLYWDGVALATKDFTLATNQVLGSDTIYLGGNLEWTSGGGIKYRDKYIDTFILYNGALTEDEVKSIPAYVSENGKAAS